MVEANPKTAEDGKEDVIEDADVFKAKEQDIFTDDFAYQFSVKNP